MEKGLVIYDENGIFSFQTEFAIDSLDGAEEVMLPVVICGLNPIGCEVNGVCG